MHMMATIILLALAFVFIFQMMSRMPSMPSISRPSVGGTNSSPVAPPGASYFDSICREADVTAVDTWTAISGWAGATPGSV